MGRHPFKIQTPNVRVFTCILAHTLRQSQKDALVGRDLQTPLRGRADPVSPKAHAQTASPSHGKSQQSLQKGFGTGQVSLISEKAEMIPW